jgi:Uma2 family endonuclease
MGRALSVSTFLRRYNRAGQYELVFGKVRPAVHLSEHHATLVKRLHQALAKHLAEDNRGTALTGRIDVVLDYLHGIVLHPPLVVLLEKNKNRLRTRTQVWGAPDVVLEVLTRATARRTRHTRVRWYRQWGVRECWLLDTRSTRFEVLGQLQDAPHIFSGEQTIVSSALPEFRPSVDNLFAETQSGS